MVPVAESNGMDGSGMHLHDTTTHSNEGNDGMMNAPTSTDKPEKLSQWTKNRYVAKIFPNLKSPPDSSTNTME